MKYYFDTSSLVKVYHPEIGTKEALDLYLSDTPILISELSRIELLSTIYRKYREREINSDILDALLLRFQEDVESRYELLEFTSLVLENATRLMAKFGKAHSLKTLDTLQFAFFTTYADKDDVFVCSDHRLANFARVEGSAVYVPKGSIPEHREDVSREAGRRRKLFLSPPHMGGEELPFVQQAFESNYIAPLGPMVDAFEREFAEYVGIRHCAAVSSGTAAIHLALRILGIGPGDEMIASTFTFIGGVTPILFQGAIPIFIDCDRSSWNMDPDLLAEELESCKRRGKMPKAVVPTDLYGQCCDLPQIVSICNQYDIPVVCDSAEAMGAKYQLKAQSSKLKGKKVEVHAGVGAKAAVFSFNGNKIITTSGGGMLVSDDEDLVEQARFLSQQARDPAPYYEHSTIGYNYRMSNILAAIGRGQLRVLDDRVEAKRRIFAYYQEKLGSIPGIEFMPEAPYGRSNRWLTVILITPKEFGADSEAIQQALEEENIEARPVWKPMHMQPVFNPQIISRKGAKTHNGKNYKARIVGGSVAEDLFNRGLCLPSGTAMTEGDLDRVIDTILNCKF